MGKGRWQHSCSGYDTLCRDILGDQYPLERETLNQGDYGFGL